jgi:uncharacterized membrane protein
MNRAGLALIGAVVSSIIPPHAFAHGIDERPGLGAGITIILSVFWIAVVLGIVFFVRRLVRSRPGDADNRKGEGITVGKEKKGPPEQG